MTPIEILNANALGEPLSFLGKLHEEGTLDQALFQELLGAIAILIHKDGGYELGGRSHIEL
jgi:hypothetical protein